MPPTEFSILRQRAGLRQADLARLGGWHSSLVSDWERGVRQPRRAPLLVLRILAALPEEVRAGVVAHLIEESARERGS